MLSIPLKIIYLIFVCGFYSLATQDVKSETNTTEQIEDR